MKDLILLAALVVALCMGMGGRSFSPLTGDPTTPASGPFDDEEPSGPSGSFDDDI